MEVCEKEILCVYSWEGEWKEEWIDVGGSGNEGVYVGWEWKAVSIFLSSPLLCGVWRLKSR